MKTRSDMRMKKNKQNLILNSLIGVVFIFILIIGGNMLFGDSNTTSGTEDQQNSAASEGESNGKDNSVQITEDENADEKSETASSNQEENADQQEGESQQDVHENNEQGNNKSEQNGNDNDDQENQEENESQQDGSGPNSENIGEPIGTSQTGEHTSSYDKGSVDWNEKVKAIKMATGLDDSMTLWRLEGGGGPHQSVGKVSPEGVQDWMYVVNLQWVDQKGWKVTSVNRQSR
ncbi:YrrS family protein [Lentibacillus jeotgali]|uniref:YrrS family protein n=1 Tax=Lentibacillus jeotgali TaxID=558169 RepID=UPI0002627FFC|nr:YrrS family protein [Lentibacillus jeotgali]